MKSIACIYLVWRKGKGTSRKIVGIIKRNSKGITFNYLKVNLESARKDGFTSYVDFPDVNKVYTENVIDIFAQRLTKSDRPDYQKYLDFWGIEKENINNKYYLLARTQGLLATDNFEFLADYNPEKGLSFISEISGLTHNTLKRGMLSKDDELTWEPEPSNLYDKMAIKLYKGDSFIGYVKLIHNKIFSKQGNGNIRVRVKSIEETTTIQRVFIVVNM